MRSNRSLTADDGSDRIAVLTLVWTHLVQLLTVLGGVWRRVPGRVTARFLSDACQVADRRSKRATAESGSTRNTHWPTSLPGFAPARLWATRLGTGTLCRPAITVGFVIVTMSGLAAAQSSTGGVCGTPAVDLFEWAARTGAGLMFLGGLLYGGFQLGRSVISRNPEKASHHRRNGTISLLAGPIFGMVIVFGKQGAAAAGFTVAECAHLTPWF